MATKVYTVELPNKDRTLSAVKLADCAKQYCEQVQVKESIRAAVEAAIKEAGQENPICEKKEEGPVIIACGSLSYLGEVKRIVDEATVNKNICG